MGGEAPVERKMTIGLQTMSQSSSKAQQNYSKQSYHISTDPIVQFDNHEREEEEGKERKTNLPTSNARTQRVITNTDLLIHDMIREIVPAAGHSTDEDGDVVCCGDGGEVF